MQKQQRHSGVMSEPSCCLRFMRLFLIVINIFLILLGIGAIAVGGWSLTDEYGADNLEVILDTDLYTAGAVLLIVGGALLILTALMGILGSFLGNRCILGAYFGIMLFFGVLFVAGVVVAAFLMDEVEDALGDKMEETLKINYGVNVTTNSRNRDITTAWKDFQRSLKCCGVRGGLTGSESWFLWQSSQWFETEGKTGAPLNWVYVPETCCDTSGDNLLTACQRLNSDNTVPPQNSVAGVTTENPALYHKGCLDALEEKVDDHMAAIIGIAVVAFLTIVVCAVFSLVVCMEAGRLGKVV